MESATSRFFSIAELVIHLALFLNQSEISRMMQTSRRMNELFTPAFYYDVNAEYQYKKHKIFNSKDSIQALAKSTHHVRQLTLKAAEVAYFATCIIAYQDDLLLQAATDRATNGHPPQQQFFQTQQPLWLAPPDPRDCEVFPIPPTTLLTKLNFHPEFIWPLKDCSYLLPSVMDPKAILTYLCWIMDLNPNLLDVSLDRVIIKDQRDIRLLTTSISGLKNLQRLRLGFYHEDDWKMPSDLPLVLFHCCPSSLQSLDLSIVTEVLGWEDSISKDYLIMPQGRLQPWEWDEVECDIPATIPRRQEPLLYLTSLDISDSRDPDVVTENDLARILAHCPNLTNLGLPCLSVIIDLDQLAKEITHLCPKLSCVRSMDAHAFTAQKLAVRLLETLPEQQVEVFSSVTCSRIMDMNITDFGWLFQRHSSTLRSIEFSGFQNYDSRIIQVILVQCVALEMLSVSWTELDTQHQLCINLEDAIEFPWGCTNIQKLNLTIAIPDEPLHHFAEGMVPYYNRPAPITLSTVEKDQFKFLETFYRQIGSLTKLRNLNLRAIYYDPQGQRPISKGLRNTFPGMLSLGCEETGRPGFLHHLAGLTKLKSLLGSMSQKVIVMEELVRARDIEWMKRHWPMMEEYSLYLASRRLS